MLNSTTLVSAFDEIFSKAKEIYIGFSGGVDSTVLLDLAYHYNKGLIVPRTITALHINHNINKNSSLWDKNCAKICEDYQIQYKSVTITPLDTSEEELRNLRYSSFAKMIREVDHALLLAHHKQDQIETILFRLFRGTRIKGLKGIDSYKFNERHSLHLYRPLINIDKVTLINYAKYNNLSFVNDESNLENKYDRNYIRNSIYPLIKKKWPKFEDKILELTDLSNSYESYYLKQHPELLNKDLEIDKIVKLKDDEKSLYILSWLSEHKVAFANKHVNIIINEIINAQENAKPQLKLADRYVVKAYNKIYLLDDIGSDKSTTVEWQDKDNDIYLDNDIILNKDNLNLPYRNYLVKTGHPLGKRFSKICQNKKIPYWQRGDLIRVFDKNTEKLMLVYSKKENKIIWQKNRIFNDIIKG